MRRTRRGKAVGYALDHGHRSRWIAGRRFLVYIIGIQLAVPILAFVQEPPTRLGWQMYSGIGELPSIRVRTKDGSIEDIPFMDIAASRRGEIAWRDHLPRFVCERTLNAIEVELQYSDISESFECDVR